MDDLSEYEYDPADYIDHSGPNASARAGSAGIISANSSYSQNTAIISAPGSPYSPSKVEVKLVESRINMDHKDGKGSAEDDDGAYIVEECDD